MALDDGARYAILAAVIVLVFGFCVIAAFWCIDNLADKSKYDDNRTQVSTLTQSGDGGTTPSVRRKRKVRIEGEVASEASSLLDDGTHIKTDKALMDTFVKVLSQGINIKMHFLKENKPPKVVKLQLDQNFLTWKSAQSKSLLSMVKKPQQLDITTVKTIEWGKRTPTFRNSQSVEAKDEECLSLVSDVDGLTLDLEAASGVERDSLAQGFTILINAKNQVDQV